MLISICIPHYNRSGHLLKVLDTIQRQDHQEFEVIISDDCSDDDSFTVVQEYIANLDLSCSVKFRYIRQKKNLGYDINLRNSLGAASGEYLLILGNDDALPHSTTLSYIANTLEKLGKPEVAVGNYFQYGSQDCIVRRVSATGIAGKGPYVALRSFRLFSFVAGIILRRDAFLEHDTNTCDGSVYAQMYLGARIIASGGTLGTIREAIVAKDVTIGGDKANSYLDFLERDNAKITPRMGGLDQVGRVICDAILPLVPSAKCNYYHVKIYQQLISYSYANWLYQYRLDGVYLASVNLALGCTPGNLLRFRPASLLVHSRVWLVFLPVTLAGLLAPIALLKAIKLRIHQGQKPRDNGQLS
jgi:glycosyltransferase involved in cell wall biosynthesis